MKKVYLFLIVTLMTCFVFGQNVGISNDPTLVPSEALHVKSTLNAEHGILIESTIHNPMIQWKQGITTQFTLGVDNADADKLKSYKERQKGHPKREETKEEQDKN